MDRSIEQHRHDHEIRLARAAADRPGEEARRTIAGRERDRRRRRWAGRLRAAADRLDG